MKILLSILIVLGLCACKSDKEILLEKSVEQAGAKKIELMALLNGLKHDSLAYEAGLFLIGNMTGNYSVSSDQIVCRILNLYLLKNFSLCLVMCLFVVFCSVFVFYM